MEVVGVMKRVCFDSSCSDSLSLLPLLPPFVTQLIKIVVEQFRLVFLKVLFPVSFKQVHFRLNGHLKLILISFFTVSTTAISI